jgi:hypothetical protein
MDYAMGSERVKAESKNLRLPRIIPEELRELLSSRPLLSNERAEDYDQLLTSLAVALEPKDVIEWVWCKDVQDLIWECRRLRAIKAELIETYKLDAARIFGLNTSQLPKPEEEEIVDRSGNRVFQARVTAGVQVEELIRQAKFADAKGETRRVAQIETELFEHWGVNFSDISARALGWHLDEVVQIEQMIASCEKRRDQTLREIERRREKVKVTVRSAQDLAFSERDPV